MYPDDTHPFLINALREKSCRLPTAFNLLTLIIFHSLKIDDIVLQLSAAL
jgi:hypothetical protein